MRLKCGASEATDKTVIYYLHVRHLCVVVTSHLHIMTQARNAVAYERCNPLQSAFLTARSPCTLFD